MLVTVYEVPQRDDFVVPSRPLHELPKVSAQVDLDSTVAQVLSAGGVDFYRAFVLLTSDMVSDVSLGVQREIYVAYNVLGIDDEGAVYYRSGQEVPWRDFVRANDAGLIPGDVSQLVVYPSGVAGGLIPDGLWEMVLYLFQNRDPLIAAAGDLATLGAGVATIGGAAHWVSNRRKQAIARQWRKQGFTGPRIAEYVRRLPQWDVEQLARQMKLTAGEARCALLNAGYGLEPDGQWRLSNAPEALQRQDTMQQLEDDALSHPDNWDDSFDFPEATPSDSDDAGP